MCGRINTKINIHHAVPGMNDGCKNHEDKNGKTYESPKHINSFNIDLSLIHI